MNSCSAFLSHNHSLTSSLAVMASFSLGDHVKLRTCPYNPAHKVASTKYASHIVKCAKQTNTPRLIACPYYSGHRITENVFADHVNKCPYKSMSEFNSQGSQESKNESQVSSGFQAATQDQEEKWDF